MGTPVQAPSYKSRVIPDMPGADSSHTHPVDMPLVVIHTVRAAYTPEQLRSIGDNIYQTMRRTFNAPDEDRYQIITQHEPYELMCSDTGLGFKRSDKLICLQIVQQGRDSETKQAFYSAALDALKSVVQLENGDLIISTTANRREDWSFGAGRAQLVTGKL